MLYDGLFVPACADNCNYCDTAGECTVCNEGYRVNNGIRKCDVGQLVFITSLVMPPIYENCSCNSVFVVMCVVNCNTYVSAVYGFI